MYEVGTRALVTAWHVMPGMEGPEGELHSHDYRIDVVVTRDELDDKDMVCDLDVLGAALSGAAEQVRDKNLEIIQPPEAAAVTVEIFARWVHDQLHEALVHSGARGSLQVRVWETPDAFGGYSGALS